MNEFVAVTSTNIAKTNTPTAPASPKADTVAVKLLEIAPTKGTSPKTTPATIELSPSARSGARRFA